MPNYDHVLRSEIIISNKKAVIADIKKPFFKLSSATKNMQDLEDYSDLLNLSYELKTVVIPRVVAELDDIKKVCLTSKQLTDFFHSEGINIRHLGIAIKYATQYHVKILFITEVLARTAKNIYNETISEHIVSIQKDKIYIDSNIEDYCLICTVDFLNLLFGNSEEHNAFL